MKVNIIANGVMKMVITSESDIEKQMLLEVFRGPVDIQILDKVQILNTALVDSVLIVPAKKEQSIAEMKAEIAKG